MRNSRTLGVRAAALRMGCTLKYVYDLLYAGRLRGAEKQGRNWLIPPAAIDKHLKARGRNND